MPKQDISEQIKVNERTNCFDSLIFWHLSQQFIENMCFFFGKPHVYTKYITVLNVKKLDAREHDLSCYF